MKEKIERFSKGIFEYEQPETVLSQDVLTIFIPEGETQTGSFVISNSENTPMKGLLYSSSGILRLGTGAFSGISNEITYEVNCRHMEQGEKVEGRIDIVSDCGERQLPFTITVLKTNCNSSVGNISNFFSFQSLAQTNWNEALELFDGREFHDAVIKNDSVLKSAYETLKASPDRNLALEEFLNSRRKKSECGFTVDTAEISNEVDPINFMERIRISKTSWGYLKLRVEAEPSFIRPSKDVIENSDFENGRFELRFIANLEGMRAGRHIGMIRIYNALHEICIPVTYRVRDGREELRKRRLFAKKYVLNIVDHLIGFRTGRTDLESFREESLRHTGTLLSLADREIETGENDDGLFSYLSLQLPMYRAFLLALAKDEDPMNGDIFRRLLPDKEEYARTDPVTYAAILFIENLALEDPEIKKANTEKIKSIYAQNSDNALLLLFNIHSDPLLIADDRKKYDCIKNLLDRGCNSSLLLCEAGLILKDNPAFLEKAGITECRIILFMVGNGIATGALVDVFAAACRGEGRTSLLMETLIALYDENGDESILEAICKRLIDEGAKDRRYFRFFREAVLNDLDIPLIYEYYLFSYGTRLREPMDMAVLGYFFDVAGLPEENLAVLYAEVVRQRAGNDDVYKAYRESIVGFAINALKERKISPELAVIYEDVLERGMLDSTLVNCVPDVIFSHRVSGCGKRLKNIIVSNEAESTEGVYPLINGAADVLIYTDVYSIWTEDEEGNRYALRDDIRTERFLKDTGLLADCYEDGATNPRLLLCMWEKNLRYNFGQNSYIALQKQISGIETLRPEVANDCFFKLADYYYEHYDGELLETYLAKVDIRILDPLRRNKMIELMIVRDMYDKVIEYVKEFGCELMAMRRLSKLCLHAIESPEIGKDKETLVTMSHFAFKNGNVDPRVLKYILDNFNGTTAERYEIWHAAKQAGMDTRAFEENMLGQILFTETYLENSFGVFESYRSKTGDSKLIRAFILYTAYKYFVFERITDSAFFDILKRFQGLENSNIAKLALLKFYSEKEELTKEEKAFSERFLRQLLQKKISYAFFRDFGKKIALPESIFERCCVEYRTNPKKTVCIHYSYDSGNRFRTEVMPDAGYGIFTREFILFYGETLQYFITESDGEEEEITESRAVTFTEDPTDRNSNRRYDEINDILIAAEMRDNKTLIDYLHRYYLTEYIIKRNFKPV